MGWCTSPERVREAKFVLSIWGHIVQISESVRGESHENPSLKEDYADDRHPGQHPTRRTGSQTNKEIRSSDSYSSEHLRSAESLRAGEKSLAIGYAEQYASTRAALSQG